MRIPILLITVCALVIGLALTGCGENKDTPNAIDSGGDPQAHDEDGENHGDAGHDHADEAADHHPDAADHDSDHDDEMTDAGMRDLGSIDVADVVLHVAMSGELEPNADMHVEMEHESGPVPAAVRVWVGEKSGVGSMKMLADGHDDHYHVHAEAPAVIAGSTALWIEVEDANGTRTAVSVDLD